MANENKGPVPTGSAPGAKPEETKAEPKVVTDKDGNKVLEGAHAVIASTPEQMKNEEKAAKAEAKIAADTHTVSSTILSSSAGPHTVMKPVMEVYDSGTVTVKVDGKELEMSPESAELLVKAGKAKHVK